MNTIIRISVLFLITNALLAQGGYELVWSDEFEYNGLPDEKKWSYDIGDGCPNVCGWGNNELEYYTEKRLENARVEEGQLIITAIKENFGSKNYTSARLVSREKGDWTYGRIEVRAKLPAGVGTWPAIWMLSTDWSYGGWPESGEIDIMEHVGYEPDSIYGTVHTKAYNHGIGTQRGGKIEITDCEEEFHVYAIEWTYNKIDFFVDDNKYFTFEKEQGSEKWPFDKRFHLLLNLAVGGNWGGAKGVDESVFPQQMKVDYVRVYQLVSNVDKKLGTGELLLMPNPASEGHFTINTQESVSKDLQIFDLSGRAIPFTKSIDHDGVKVHLHDMTKQVLLVSMNNGEGKRLSDRILVR